MSGNNLTFLFGIFWHKAKSYAKKKVDFQSLLHMTELLNVLWPYGIFFFTVVFEIDYN